MGPTRVHAKSTELALQSRSCSVEVKRKLQKWGGLWGLETGTVGEKLKQKFQSNPPLVGQKDHKMPFSSWGEGTIKDRSSKDLTEAEEMKKRWQEYTELYKRS